VVLYVSSSVLFCFSLHRFVWFFFDSRFCTSVYCDKLGDLGQYDFLSVSGEAASSGERMIFCFTRDFLVYGARKVNNCK